MYFLLISMCNKYYIYTVLHIHYIKGRRWYSGQAFDPPISAGHLSLFDITAEWSKTTQILPYPPQTGLIMLYALEALAAISLDVLNIFKRERKLSRRHYKINLKKLTPNNKQEESSSCFYNKKKKSLLAPMIYDIENRIYIL